MLRSLGLIELGLIDQARLMAWASVLAFLAWSCPSAAETGPGLTPRALPGVVRLGLPAPAPRGFALGASFGGGWIDPIGTPPVEAARLQGSVAAAYSPLPALTFGLDFSGHTDFLSTPEQNATSEPRLTFRALLLPTGPVRLGLEADVRFVGAAAPSIDWKATSPSWSALIGCAPAPGSWLGATVGFHLDRSAAAVPDPSAVSPADRITLGASSSPAVRVGVGGTHRVGSTPFVLLGEFTADLLVLDSAPPLGQSPMRLTAGARYQLTPGLSLLASADAEFSSRPSSLTGDTLLPIQPRLGGLLAITWTLQPEKHAPPAKAAAPAAPAATPPPAAAPPPAAPTSSVRGRVVDEAGHGLPDAEVTLDVLGKTLSVRTLADGTFEFPEVADAAAVRAQVSASGFDAAQANLEPARDRKVELVVHGRTGRAGPGYGRRPGRPPRGGQNHHRPGQPSSRSAT